MKTKFACCDLTKNVAAFEARNTISSNFRFRLQDLPKKIARFQTVAINRTIVTVALLFHLPGQNGRDCRSLDFVNINIT